MLVKLSCKYTLFWDETIWDWIFVTAELEIFFRLYVSIRYTLIERTIMIRFAAVVAFVFLTFGTVRATTHTIKFGGSLGKKYSPASLNVNVGDTIVWTGDFDQHTLTLVKAPAGAKGFKGIETGHTFRYIVTVEGRYDYICEDHVDQGMTGSFTAAAAAPAPAGQK